MGGCGRGFWKDAKPRCHRRKKEPSPGTKSPFSPWISSLLCISSSLSHLRFAGDLRIFFSFLAPPNIALSYIRRPQTTPIVGVSCPSHLSRSMASDQEAANALKLQGNKAFAEHEWPTAVDFYTQAIEKYDKEPSFFCNRAQVRRPPTTDLPLRAMCSARWRQDMLTLALNRPTLNSRLSDSLSLMLPRRWNWTPTMSRSVAIVKGCGDTDGAQHRQAGRLLEDTY